MIEKKQTRDFGIDLFRIVCMLMVVCLHYLGHGGLTEGALTLDMPNWFTGHIVGCVCMVSVNGFVLISGYFLCTSKFRLSKWISSYIQTLCYSVGIYLAFAAIGAVPLSWERLAEAAMVLTRKQYWFITAYLLLLAISPFLNMAMDAMSQKIHLLCCSVLVGIFPCCTRSCFPLISATSPTAKACCGFASFMSSRLISESMSPKRKSRPPKCWSFIYAAFC